MTPVRMPAVFVGHGSPMNTLEQNRFTEAWTAWAVAAPRPRAVLAVSAHWYVSGTAVTTAERPRTIHDFTGFPPELFAVRYPAPGDPALAARVAEVLAPVPVVADDAWGLDHGTWSVLAHLYPDADVPVVQLSVDADLDAAGHLRLGRALAPLRDDGVLVLGSGNVVHNLGLLDWTRPDAAAAWNDDFDHAARVAMTTDPGSVVDLVGHPAYATAVPSPDHLVPLYYIAGLAVAAGTPARVLVTGGAFDSLSMTSYVVD